MNEKIKKAIGMLDIWNAETLQKEYDQQLDTLSKPKTEEPGKKLSLEELVAEAIRIADKNRPDDFEDSDFEGIDLDKIFASIDAKIAELEAEEAKNKAASSGDEKKGFHLATLAPLKAVREKTEPAREITPELLEKCAPKPDFDHAYFRGYAKAFLSCMVSREDAIPFRMIPMLFGSSYYQSMRRMMYVVDEDLPVSLLDRNILNAKKAISGGIDFLVKETEYDPDKAHLLAFYLELLQVLLAVEKCTADRTPAELKEEAKTYLNYFLADGLYRKNSKSYEGLPYAKQALALSEPGFRQNSFNVLSLCAYNARDKQLAYDTYLSWIRQEPVGMTKEFWPEGFSFGSGEDDWRKSDGKNKAAIMHNNFAFIAAAIAETYELQSCERKTFYDIALEQIQMALDLAVDSSYYRTYGLILREMNAPVRSSQECMKLYRKADDCAGRLADRLPSRQYYCDAMLDEFLHKLITSGKSSSEWLEEMQPEDQEALQLAMANYRHTLELAKKDSSISEADKRDSWNAFEKFQKSRNQSKIDSLGLSLLLISQVSEHLMRFLRRNAYSKKWYLPRSSDSEPIDPPERSPGRDIAYYTSLNTVMYLFDVMLRPDKDAAPVPVKKGESGYEDGVNCLTMMQTYYMNDPYEGLAFERGVSGGHPMENILFHHGNAWQFREDIFQKNFVFLKSFTDRMDNLLMWNRYGSDRETGSRDSNGCCIRFSPEFFDVINDEVDEARNLLVDKEDDYRLYRVVYLDQKGQIDPSKNPGLDENARICYDRLLELLRYVNGVLNQLGKDEPVIDAVRRYVQYALNPVIFLFKDDDYADEQEYRLVVSRPNSDLRNIRMLPGKPEKACINPYFQVCIDKVILGPNVEQPEHWFNHFRYHIAEMWRRALGPDGEIPDITVQKSSIHYHT